MLLFKWMLLVVMLVSLSACEKENGPTGTATARVSGNAVFIDTAGLVQFKDVSSAILAELEKNREIKLVKERKDANIYLGINAIIPEDINETTRNNYIVLSYVLVNFDNKNATEGLGMGQRNMLEPFVTNVSTVLSGFVRQPASVEKKP
jgi:hypothetical protein